MISAYVALTKPRITWLIVMSTGVGYALGMRESGSWWRLLHTLLGTGLLASGTAALNQWWERDADALMRRTSRRPIPSGDVTATSALIFGIAISLAGFLELALGANWLAAACAMGTLLMYLLVYTPLKRRTWWCTAIGAVPGAMPLVIGFAASRRRLTEEALVLFGILFLWQFPHFYSIAWMYKEDYARAGIRMLPVVESDCRSTARQMVIGSLALLVVSLAPAGIGMTSRWYLAGAMPLGLWLVWASGRAAKKRSLQTVRAVLLATVIQLPLLYGVLLLGRA